MRRVVTIGVYGWDLRGFLEVLRTADVRLLLDVRQRRGVRGREYAWANSLRLQRALAEAGVGYQHHAELAPTTELRQLQYAEDARMGVGKRSRVELAPEYVARYTREILDHVDLHELDGGSHQLMPQRVEGAQAHLDVARSPVLHHFVQ